jgi:hypothetical protein
MAHFCSISGQSENPVVGEPQKSAEEGACSSSAVSRGPGDHLTENADGYRPLRITPMPPLWPHEFPICPLMLQKGAIR